MASYMWKSCEREGCVAATRHPGEVCYIQNPNCCEFGFWTQDQHVTDKMKAAEKAMVDKEKHAGRSRSRSRSHSRVEIEVTKKCIICGDPGVERKVINKDRALEPGMVQQPTICKKDFENPELRYYWDMAMDNQYDYDSD